MSGDLNIPEGFLPHVLGVFRMAMEEHLPLDLINDWDLNQNKLNDHRVLVLANAAALSEAQVEAVRRYVQDGGGLVATCETSLCNELGQPRRDFALADLFGVSSRERTAAAGRSTARANAALAADGGYWRRHVCVGRLSWEDHPVWRDPKLNALVPARSATFKGPFFPAIPSDTGNVAARLALDAEPSNPQPAVIVRPVGKGRVVYFAAGVDAALWSYGYPYQRRLLARALQYAAGIDCPIRVEAPMCVQATFFRQRDAKGHRTIIHLFNGLNTTGGHGLPEADVPLREEAVRIPAIKVHFRGPAPKSVHVEPGGSALAMRQEAQSTVVEMPPLDIHAMLVAEGY
jgi:hypothetical protein